MWSTLHAGIGTYNKKRPEIFAEYCINLFRVNAVLHTLISSRFFVLATNFLVYAINLVTEPLEDELHHE